MAWIKMRMGFQTHPKVVRITSALNADVCPHRVRVIGALYAVWCLADEHTEDGCLPGYTLAALDESVGWPGFAQALKDVEWLIETPQGLVLPRFDLHNGASAKRRAMEAERKKLVRKMSAPDADVLPPREEKEKKKAKALRKVNGSTGLHFMPEGWNPTDATRLALTGEGYGDIDRYRDWFRDSCWSKGKKYKNFDLAFRNCVRSDWPRFRNGRPPPSSGGKFVPA